MFNLTGSEIMFLLVIGLVVLGPEKLPDAIRRVGRLYAELKRMSSGVQTDLRKVMDEPLKEMMSTTNTMKSLFSETANQFQGVAKEIIEPSFIEYSASGTSSPAENLEEQDSEIEEAIVRTAQIASERVLAKNVQEDVSANALDDVS